MNLRTLIAYMMPSKLCARMLGVKMGNNVLISTKKWSTEPWLITIGNNVQVTKDVYFHTHMVAVMWLAASTRTLTALAP